MSRAIKLTQIHAINWYGYNDSLPVEGNLLLAGITGSGKSVLMDLIMAVLVGTDAAHHHFNRSATGGQSDRTLKSYCLLDTKREENGVEQYLRQAAITYIAMEFSWPPKADEERRVETWGIRVEFRNTAENQGHPKPFMVPGVLTKADFLDSERRPLEAAQFKHFVEKARDGRLFETQEQYLRDMANNQHLNFNRAVLCSLLPQAMSFTNLKNFDEFCRKFILPDDKLNVTDVVASYRDFKAYESDLKALFDQKTRLELIRDLHGDYTAAIRDQVVARWLASELAYAHVVACVREQAEKLEVHQSAFSTEQARITELDRVIPERESQIKREEVALKALPGGELYLELKEQAKELNSKATQLSDIGNTVDSALRNRAQKARLWLNEVKKAPLTEPVDTGALVAAITTLESCSIDKTEDALGRVSEEADFLKGALVRAINPTERNLSKLREQKSLLNEEINLLKNGQLPFPTRVLNALNQQLPSTGNAPAAQPLCKLCEVVDEDWRAAIEVAFNRKFAVVVSDANYPAALRIYQGLKEESPQESLIHPGKALRMARLVKPGSLAEKLHSEHPIAQSIITSLFGELICVHSNEDLSKHDFAIQKDGFMTRGAFVERRRHYDGMPFVGLRGLERQLALKRGLLTEVEAKERQLAPLVNAVQSVINRAAEFIPAHTSLIGDLRDAKRLPELKNQLQNVLDRLNNINRASFEEKEKELTVLNEELTNWKKELRELDRSQKKGEIDGLKRVLGEMKEKEASALRAFDQVKKDIPDISVHATRLISWKSEVLTAMPALDAAAREFERAEGKAETAAGQNWEKLVAERQKLALVFRKYEDFVADNKSNDPWAKQLDQIAGANIPDYKAKAETERKRWEQLFRSNVLQRMDQALRKVNETILLLNEHLKQPIGNDQYEIERRQNPDFKLYRQLIDLNSQYQDDGLFYQAVQGELQDALDRFLQIITSSQDSATATNLLDYRQYFDYDLLVWDSRDSQAKPVSVDKQSRKMSGGENQSPYFVAILASYLRAYNRHERRWNDPSLALVPIDEAFSKMDTERIKNCIGAIKTLDLQGAFSMSTGNVAAFSLCDQLIVVSRHEERRANKPHIRNVPVSILRDSEEGREWMQEHV